MIEQLKLTLPLDLYGVGNAKSFSKLVAEIKSGETQIIFEEYKPIRLIQVARVYVSYGDLKLVEAKQVIKGQGERIRNLDCVSEKFKIDESAINAAVRGLKEELKVFANYSELESLERKSESKESPSPSYPGLTTRYDFYNFRYAMPGRYYHPQGYIADEGDTVTYFEWR